MPVAFAYRCD